MTIESRSQGWDHCNNHQGQDCESQDQVSDQDHIIKRSHPTFGGESHGAFSDGAEQAEVIRQIAGQENRRTDQRRDHASDMDPFLISTNGDPSGRNKAGTQGIQGRVHRRKIKNIHLTSGLKNRTNDKIGWSPERIKSPKSPPFACRTQVSKRQKRVGADPIVIVVVSKIEPSVRDRSDVAPS
jgi:hypothetical protein